MTTRSRPHRVPAAPDPTSLATWTVLANAVTAADRLLHAIHSLPVRGTRKWKGVVLSTQHSHTTLRLGLSYSLRGVVPIEWSQPHFGTGTYVVAPEKVPFQWSRGDFMRAGDVFRACMQVLRRQECVDERDVYKHVDIAPLAHDLHRAMQAVEAPLREYTMLIRRERGMERLSGRSVWSDSRLGPR